MKAAIEPERNQHIRIDVIALDGQHSACWYANGRALVTRIENGCIVAEQTCYIRAEFDALCLAWGIEPVGTVTKKKTVKLDDIPV